MPKTPSNSWNHLPRLGSAAKEGLLIRCHCNLCRRTMHYLASDLLQVFGPMTVVGEIWGSCPRCGKSEWWSESERYPSSDDVGHTLVRRPAGFRKIRLWRNEYYGPPAYGPPRPIE